MLTSLLQIASLALVIAMFVISYIYGQSYIRRKSEADDLPVKFRKDWPQIDDEEFLRRCPEGTDPETALKIRRTVSLQLGVEYARLYPTRRISEGLDL